MKHRKQRGIKGVAGVGLIEVLVSLLVLSVGILGIVGLQTRALQLNQGVLYQSRANVLAYDIMDRMRSNQSQIDNYQIGLTDPKPAYTNCQLSTANCSPAQMTDFDLGSWRDEVENVLPSGTSSIVRTGGAQPSFIVTLQFDSSRVESASAAGQEKLAAGESIIQQVSFRTAF
ncbi:type IV pilus modification protein PilV [Marinobacter sp. 1-3A]|uniref:type IV pilus modification protein PilV n=1 Tax=Marinobacter sp. 1-3A TaxID=2582920 RepID=UPI001907AD45|nr:type IV pilus modification protein PilV [Marinobacter sp. 1-3A]MBK1874670.1 type IV pilus modification protein PilV [Marinobacter sp. 1-3A]